MKLFSKFIFILFLITTTVEARKIIQINYEQFESKAELVKNILIKEFNIPIDFITLKIIKNPCIKNKHIIFQICITEKGIVNFSNMNQKVILNILAKFQKLQKD